MPRCRCAMPFAWIRRFVRTWCRNASPWSVSIHAGIVLHGEVGGPGHWHGNSFVRTQPIIERTATVRTESGIQEGRKQQNDGNGVSRQGETEEKIRRTNADPTVEMEKFVRG